MPAAQAAFELPAPEMGAQRAKVAPHTLEVSDLTVRYGGVIAVDGLSLAVRPGQIVGLIGPNGAGKTSAIDAITGFTRAAAGSVRLNELDLTGNEDNPRYRTLSVIRRRSFQVPDCRRSFHKRRKSDQVDPKDPPARRAIVIRPARMDARIAANKRPIVHGEWVR